MKIADSYASPYKPAMSRQAAGFDPAQFGLSVPGGRPDTLNRRMDGGTDRAGAGEEAEAVVATASNVNISAAFWAISAEKLEKRAASVEKAAQAAAASATADKAATRLEFMDWAGKSTAEKIRAQILKGRNLSEEDLPKMDPAERKALEAEITEAVKRQLGLEDDVVKDAGASSQSTNPQEQET